MRRTVLPMLALAAGVAVGCSDRLDVDGRVAESAGGEGAPVHVDSILPIDEEMRRFRARVGRTVDGLADAESTRDALVGRFIAALEAADTADLARLALDPAEFIDLHYPHTIYTAEPYELSPAVVWILLSGDSGKGLVRLLRRYGGRPVGYRGYRCGPVRTEGPNRIHDGCVVEVAARGMPQPVRLFGSIIERAGRFAFVSYANDL